MKSSQSNFNIRSPRSDLVHSYLITTLKNLIWCGLFYPYNFWIKFSISNHCDNKQVQHFAKIRRIWSNFPILACTKAELHYIMFSVCYSDTPSNQGFFKRQLFWDLPCLEENNFSPKKKLWKLLSWGKERDCNYEVSDLCCKNNLVSQIIAFSSKAATEGCFNLFVFCQALCQINCWLQKYLMPLLNNLQALISL